MIDIIRLYIFRKIEHSADEDERVLWDDAEIVMEKFEGIPMAITLKTPNTRHENNAKYEELFDLVKSTGKYNIIIECQTLN